MNNPGWIFLDKDQVDSFHRAIVDADGEDTVDQLGFNLLTNQISEKLFPWCSTLTTRARYFLSSVAILELALERTAANPPAMTTGDSLTRAQLRERSTAFQTEIMKLERILAASLYAHYLEQSGEGIFGKRNLDKIKDRQLATVMSKRLLSLPARYPNAVYRGGLHELKLFSRNPMSNTLAVQLSLNEESPFNTDWSNASQKVKTDIERCEEFWTDKHQLSKTFHKRCSNFQESTVGRSFSGFKLHGPERDFLHEKIVTNSPFLKPLEKQPKKFLARGTNLDLPGIGNAVGGDIEKIVTAAGYVNDLISPFRQMYKMIADRKELALKKTLFDVKTISCAHRNLLKTTIFSELAAVTDVTKPWVKMLISRDGYPNEDLIQHLKQRATEIVTSRRKVPPHLIAPEKRKFGKDVRDELDIIDSSFRLGNASVILRDVFGSSNAS